MNKPEFSIIIPVHSPESSLLKDCLRSISVQTFQNFECLIIVDDGSAIPALPPAFEIIRTPPCTVGAARNIGLNKARGHRIIFIDCDDMVDPNYLKTAYEIAGRYPERIISFEDAAASNPSSLPSNTRTTIYEKPMPDSRAYFFNVLCCTPNYPSIISLVVWNKVYPSKVLSQLRFCEERMLSEDVAFTISVGLQGVPFVLIYGFAPYHYRTNRHSVTHNLSPKTIGLEPLLEEYDRIGEKFLNPTEYHHYKTNIENIVVAHCLTIYFSFLRKNETDQKNRRKRSQELLDYLSGVSTSFIQVNKKYRQTLSVKRKIILFFLLRCPRVLLPVFNNWHAFQRGHL